MYLAFSDALVRKLAYQAAGDRTAKLPSVVSRKRNRTSILLARRDAGAAPSPRLNLAKELFRLILGDTEFCNLFRLRTIYSKGRA